jgi:NAD(P)-dependent dehydrogenase (short-subunit alcohol dehydrogenase family)
MKTLDGKWALITGSSRGIGRAIAKALAERGCNIILHARTLEHLASVKAEIASVGAKVHCVAGELATPAGIDAVIAAVKANPGYVDILYNNAAVSNQSTPVFEFTSDEWLRTFQVNLFAMVQLCTAFGPGMRERGYGRIVNVTSGIKDQPHLAPYSASKAAVDKYTQDLAVEFKGSNVLVNHIDPGWIKTDLGGPDAREEVSTVIPGMLVPVLLDDKGPSGRFYAAQDFKGL